MPTLGSSTAPAWAGWIEHGAYWVIGSKYTTPNFDILVQDIHCYFNTYQGNGANGWMAIFRADNTKLWSGEKGIINNGTLTAGGQQWWSWSPGYIGIIIPANTQIWLCMYSDQNIVVSTYDTSPHTFAEVNGPGGPGSIGGMADSGQGPCGAYITYSQIVKSGAVNMGSAGGGVYVPRSQNAVSSGIVNMGGSGGLLVPTVQVLAVAATPMGSQGGGMRITNSVVKQPTIYVWRKR